MDGFTIIDGVVALVIVLSALLAYSRGFVREALAAGAHTVELNLEPSAVVSDFAETRFGPASETVPAWVAELLAEAG